MSEEKSKVSDAPIDRDILVQTEEGSWVQVRFNKLSCDFVSTVFALRISMSFVKNWMEVPEDEL